MYFRLFPCLITQYQMHLRWLIFHKINETKSNHHHYHHYEIMCHMSALSYNFYCPFIGVIISWSWLLPDHRPIDEGLLTCVHKQNRLCYIGPKFHPHQEVNYLHEPCYSSFKREIHTFTLADMKNNRPKWSTYIKIWWFKR